MNAASYSPFAIEQLSLLVSGNEEARAWLQQNHYPELILTHYAIEEKEDALRELTKQKHIELVAFVHAVLDDKKAFNWLAENKKYTWAATVRVTYHDKNAEAWLMKNNLPHFAALGKAIRKKEQDQAPDDIIGLAKKLFRFLLIPNPFKKQ
jgi:hypothetical protein